MQVDLLSLRTQLRTRLEDTTASNQDFSDDELNDAINGAIRQFTSEIPFGESTTVTLAGNEYDMPTYAVVLYRVRGYFVDSSTLQFVPIAGTEYLRGKWEQDGEPIIVLPNFPVEGKYYIPRTPLADFTLYYGARRPDLTDNVDEVDLLNRAWGLDAIVSLAGYYAHFPKSAARARLEQWADRRELNVDNPLEQEGKHWLQDYERILRRFAQPTVFDR